jgi:pimeloyl-ACP methyl ester carboxylesterase
MQVVVDSLLTQYERVGEGKPVLVLHGWGDSSKGWRAFQQDLAKSYDVVVVDLPGFGGTQTPTSPWGLDEYAAFVGAFLKKISVKPYVIVAHSNGGAIAVRGISQKKLSPERLILLDSSGIRNLYNGRKKILRILTKTGKLMTLPLPKEVKKRLRRKVYKTIGSDMLVVERLQETFKRVVTDDVQSDAATLNLPVLLMYGEDDMATPVHYGRIFHNLINRSSLEIIPEAGHFAHLDKPKIVLDGIKEFLK